MKNGTILIIVWLCFGTIQAQQKIEKHINFSGKETLKLNIRIADSIKIRIWDKNEVFATASVNVNDNKDNDAYKTSFDESGNSVTINAEFSDNYFKGKKNCCINSEIYWQIYMPENTSFSAETINANISVAGKTGRMDIKSISGYIDLAVPAARQADLDFSTISGTIYSNHEMSLESQQNNATSAIRGKLNKGGQDIKLETISGDIFFRKSE